MNDFSHDTFLSPFTWRYGSPEIRAIWSEAHKRRLWRQLWVALAEAQQHFGLVSANQVADLRARVDDVDIARAHAIEAEIQHDLMAEVRTFAEQCPVGGSIIHLGATSMDIEDNADALRVRQSLRLVLARLRNLLTAFAAQIEQWADTPTMAFTHIQPAEPTTVGYRLAQYAQDLLADYTLLQQLTDGVRGKGFKGAVGTSASYAELIGVAHLAEFEARILAALDLPAFPAATQTYPRKQDYFIISALAGVAASLHKFTMDVRLLQTPPIGEWSEPFGSKQVGSSAMPFKRNPIHSEKVGSLARYLATLPRVAWDDAAGSLLERTLDDSANRRVLLPHAFLATDEILRTSQRIITGLVVRQPAIDRNMQIYGTFAATERVLMEAVKAGGDRQHLHEVIRTHALAAWDAILLEGRANPLPETLAADPEITRYVAPDRVPALLDAHHHTGDAALRARQVAAAVRHAITTPETTRP